MEAPSALELHGPFSADWVRVVTRGRERETASLDDIGDNDAAGVIRTVGKEPHHKTEAQADPNNQQGDAL
jgi:hypothetical protein